MSPKIAAEETQAKLLLKITPVNSQAWQGITWFSEVLILSEILRISVPLKVGLFHFKNLILT